MCSCSSTEKGNRSDQCKITTWTIGTQLWGHLVEKNVLFVIVKSDILSLLKAVIQNCGKVSDQFIRQQHIERLGQHFLGRICDIELVYHINAARKTYFFCVN